MVFRTNISKKQQCHRQNSVSIYFIEQLPFYDVMKSMTLSSKRVYINVKCLCLLLINTVHIRSLFTSVRVIVYNFPSQMGVTIVMKTHYQDYRQDGV